MFFLPSIGVETTSDFSSPPSFTFQTLENYHCEAKNGGVWFRWLIFQISKNGHFWGCLAFSFAGCSGFWLLMFFYFESYPILEIFEILWLFVVGLSFSFPSIKLLDSLLGTKHISPLKKSLLKINSWTRNSWRVTRFPIRGNPPCRIYKFSIAQSASMNCRCGTMYSV